MPEEGGKVRDCVRGGVEGALSTSSLEIWGLRKKEIILKVKFAYLDSKSQLGL